MKKRPALVFLFDLDGTLVDSVYQHVLAWHEAIEHVGVELSVWRIHRRVGSAAFSASADAGRDRVPAELNGTAAIANRDTRRVWPAADSARLLCGPRHPDPPPQTGGNSEVFRLSYRD